MVANVPWEYEGMGNELSELGEIPHGKENCTCDPETEATCLAPVLLSPKWVLDVLESRHSKSLSSRNSGSSLRFLLLLGWLDSNGCDILCDWMSKWKNTICEKFVRTKKMTNILTLKDEVLEYDKCKTREQKQDVWLNVQMKIHNLWKICSNKKMTNILTFKDVVLDYDEVYWPIV